MGTRIEPCEATLERLYLEFLLGQVFLVDGGDFQFPAGRRFDMFCNLDHAVGIEIEAHHGVVGLGFGRFLLDAQAVALAVELRHAIALRVVDIVAEDRRQSVLLGILHTLLQQTGESGAVEDVVAQDQAGAVVADKLFADDKGLCQSVGRRLLGILKMYAKLLTRTKQAAESWQVVWCRDNQNVADACQHQGRDGIVYHRLVEDGNQLFRYSLGDRVEACAATAS